MMKKTKLILLAILCLFLITCTKMVIDREVTASEFSGLWELTIMPDKETKSTEIVKDISEADFQSEASIDTIAIYNQSQNIDFDISNIGIVDGDLVSRQSEVFSLVFSPSDNFNNLDLKVWQHHTPTENNPDLDVKVSEAFLNKIEENTYEGVATIIYDVVRDSLPKHETTYMLKLRKLQNLSSSKSNNKSKDVSLIPGDLIVKQVHYLKGLSMNGFNGRPPWNLYTLFYQLKSQAAMFTLSGKHIYASLDVNGNVQSHVWFDHLNSSKVKKNGGGYYIFGDTSSHHYYSKSDYQPQWSIYLPKEWGGCGVRTYDFTIHTENRGLTINKLMDDWLSDSDPPWPYPLSDGWKDHAMRNLYYTEVVYRQNFKSIVKDFYDKYGDFAISLSFSQHTHNLSIYINLKHHQPHLDHEIKNHDLIKPIKKYFLSNHSDFDKPRASKVYTFVGHTIKDHYLLQKSQAGYCSSRVAFVYLFGTRDVRFD